MTRLLLLGGFVLAAVVVLAIIASIVVGIVVLVRVFRRNAETRNKHRPHLQLGEDGYGMAVVMPADDRIAWTARPPTTSDRWVSVSRSADGVVATSLNGMRVTFDPATGHVRASTLTK